MSRPKRTKRKRRKQCLNSGTPREACPNRLLIHKMLVHRCARQPYQVTFSGTMYRQRQLLEPQSVTALAQLFNPPSSFRTRSMSSCASRTMISNGASVPFTSFLLRGRNIMPPSLGLYSRLINSGLPSSDAVLRSVPGIPQRRSAAKFNQDVMYMSVPNRKASAHSVSLIRSIDLKKAICVAIQSLLTFPMVLLIVSMTRNIVFRVTLQSCQPVCTRGLGSTGLGTTHAT
jgi:hypothetical protein